MIVSPDHMEVFDSVELVFKFPYRRTVSIHLLIGAGPIFVELVDDECGVTVHHEAFNAKIEGYMEKVQCRLVLHDIVGCLEVDPMDIAKLVPRWRYEVYTCPSAVEI